MVTFSCNVIKDLDEITVADHQDIFVFNKAASAMSSLQERKDHCNNICK